MNLGIIGCGYWGPNLVRNFNSVPNVEIAYCADLDESRLRHIKSLYPKISITRDYKDILNKKEINAVVIATPIETHYRIAKDALNADKHVLVEKPITNSSDEAKELIKTAEKNKKVLMVDHTFEYSAPVRKIKEIIDKNELGQIFTIDMIRVNLGLFQEKVNVVADLAPHDISMLLYYLGSMPLSARAVGSYYIRDGIEDDAHINLLFKNKVMANLHVSWLDPCKIRRTTIVGNKKMLVFDDAGVLTPNAANSLLKILEEAPPRTVFFFVLEDDSELISTIQSRSVAVKFSTLPQEAIVADLSRFSADNEKVQLCANLSAGSLSTAHGYLRGGDFGHRDEALNFLSEFPRKPYHQIISAINKVEKEKNTITLFYLLRFLFADMLHISMGHEKRVANFDKVETLKRCREKLGDQVVFGVDELNKLHQRIPFIKATFPMHLKASLMKIRKGVRAENTPKV